MLIYYSGACRSRGGNPEELLRDHANLMLTFAEHSYDSGRKASRRFFAIIKARRARAAKTRK